MDIDGRTLFRLSDRVFGFTPEGKNELYHTILSIIKQYGTEDVSAQHILQIFDKELENRKIVFVQGITDPKSAIPKKAAFRRVDSTSDDDSDDPIQVETGVSSSFGTIIFNK